MSGGFLGRAFGLGRQLLLRGFGGVGGGPAPVTPAPGCIMLTTTATASITTTVEAASIVTDVTPTATITLTVETC